MKKYVYFLLILLLVSLTSFIVVRRLDFSVRFNNIDTENDSLSLTVSINYPKVKNQYSLEGVIEIHKNDSLFLRLITDSIQAPKTIWNFPSIPNGYRIVYPDSTKDIPCFSKKDNVKFIFSTKDTYCESWEYKPYYSNKNARWLFDKFGNQIISINSIYEPWLFGKDIIKIESNTNFVIENLDIQVLDEENRNLEFEIKHKRNPTNIIALKLKEKEKKENKLKIIILLDKGKLYEEYVSVPSRSSIGIAGKFNDL